MKKSGSARAESSWNIGSINSYSNIEWRVVKKLYWDNLDEFAVSIWIEILCNKIESEPINRVLYPMYTFMKLSMKVFLLFAITSASSIFPIRQTVKNTFHRIQRPFLRMNVTETMFTMFCLEPTRPRNADDSEDSIQLFSIKMRYLTDSQDLFCVPLDDSSIP